MPLDKDAYHKLERRFEAQVAIKRVVEGWGVYLPCVEPADQVDYIFVGMEPSFSWANDMKIAEGFRTFLYPNNDRDPVALFMHSIEQFLCKNGETFHLTDVSKGAMPVTVAALDRDRRYKDWYALLLEEIAIVGKPGSPVIAMGKEVERFLQRNHFQEETGRPLYTVQHYSLQASRYFRGEADKDPSGFEGLRERSFARTAFGRQVYPW